MTANPIIPATTAGEAQAGYEDGSGRQTQSLTPRLVPVPRPSDGARQPATVADQKPRPTTHSFAWHLIDPLRDGFELRMGATTGRPLARLTIGGIGTPSATMDVGERRLLFTSNELGNPQVAITDASTRAVVAKFEWQRPGRQGTLRFVEGGQLRWRRTGWWRRTFTVVDRFGNLLLRFYPDGRALSDALNIPLAPPVGSRDDLTLLLALGWFLQVSSGAATPPDQSRLGSEAASSACCRDLTP
jgi:hypothetical protein